MGNPRLREVFTLIDQNLSQGKLPLAVFDLDSTLFATEPRNFRIFTEFVRQKSQQFPVLEKLSPSITQDDMGWNIRQSLYERGVEDEDLLAELHRFWLDRFFTDDYVISDDAVPGAVAYVTACHQRGAMIYYLTGRHVGGMELGTVKALRSAGFPFWRGRCTLHLKPSIEMADKAFKSDALADIRSYQGAVVATYENEPGNANLFLDAFPDALHFLLETIHSPQAEAAHPQLIKTKDFVLP